MALIKRKNFRRLDKDEKLANLKNEIEAIFFLKINKDYKTGLPLPPKQEDTVVLVKD